MDLPFELLTAGYCMAGQHHALRGINQEKGHSVLCDLRPVEASFVGATSSSIRVYTRRYHKPKRQPSPGACMPRMTKVLHHKKRKRPLAC